jgi:hypothetical protein
MTLILTVRCSNYELNFTFWKGCDSQELLKLAPSNTDISNTMRTLGDHCRADSPGICTEVCRLEFARAGYGKVDIWRVLAQARSDMSAVG